MTAKQRFQQDKHASEAHFNMVASENFMRAVEASLCEMMKLSRGAKDNEESAIANYKLDGAFEFLTIFTKLADVTKEVKEKPAPANLDWKA